MTKKGLSLKQTLAKVLGCDNCFLPGTSITEKGKTFSLRPEKGEEVVGIRLDGCLVHSQSGLACDAAFFVHSRSQKRLVIALVELKGADVAHAIKQIKASRDLLANTVGCAGNRSHGEALQEHMAANTPLNHGACLLGMVVSSAGLPQFQDEALKARRYGVRLIKKKNPVGISCSDLLKQIDTLPN